MLILGNIKTTLKLRATLQNSVTSEDNSALLPALLTNDRLYSEV